MSAGRPGKRPREFGWNVQAWEVRHDSALYDPTPEEAPLVWALDALTLAVERWPSDYVLRVGLAQWIEGVRHLLVAPWGPRLDMGSCDAVLCQLARRLGYNLDRSRFDDEGDD